MQLIKAEFTGETKEKDVVAYFRRYHPNGYDTRIIAQNDEKIVVARYSCCD